MEASQTEVGHTFLLTLCHVMSSPLFSLSMDSNGDSPWTKTSPLGLTHWANDIYSIPFNATCFTVPFYLKHAAFPSFSTFFTFLTPDFFS